MFKLLNIFSCFAVLVFTSCKSNKETQSPLEQQLQLISSSPFKSIEWRAAGPDVISGRVTDVEGIPGDTSTMYAAYATSGLWKTIDGGNSWKPIFDDQATLSIGDIALAPSDNNTIYVGTGEANIFRASLPGRGMYKSTDGGVSWKNIGLNNSGTIARILVHPKDPNVLYVAAGGYEWKYNEDRGVYKSVDGGKSWSKILFQSDKIGCNDLIMHPTNPDIIYASMWNRIRKRYSDPIPEDGDYIYKTIDGGKTWTKLSNGLPDTKNTGRIGIALSPSNPEKIYAFVDDHNIKRQPEANEIDSYERKVQKVVIGGSIYCSEDGGSSWSKRGEVHDFFKPFSGTYGWVFSQIRVHPTQEDELFVMGVNIGRSIDGGKTWSKIESKNHFHGDNHAMWFDPKNPKRVIVGNDGGVSVSNDGGLNYRNFFDKMQTTQFYTIAYDMAQPFNIMGSVQDEGTWSANHTHTFGVKSDTTLRQWSYAPGGEGTQICIDPRNENIVFSSSFYGRLMKTDMTLPDSIASTKLKVFDVGRIDSLRGEWLAATTMSKHNPDVIYHGLQSVHKSIDAGKSWLKISPDLSYNDKNKMGVYPYLIYHQAITTIAEGHKQGILFVGTDDGRLWTTENDGKSWSEITGNLPHNKHVIRITSSKHTKGTIYAALNDRRSDNDSTYLYRSDDAGKNWTSINQNLPMSPANVIVEHPDKAGVLFCGTDMGVYLSIDNGMTWKSLQGNLPKAVSINDLFIHPRDKKLVIATYGRGIYVLDKLPAF
jgi:photosystem II stability/assembly factor-like uncharacterized protein